MVAGLKRLLGWLFAHLRPATCASERAFRAHYGLGRSVDETLAEVDRQLEATRQRLRTLQDMEDSRGRGRSE